MDTENTPSENQNESLKSSIDDDGEGAKKDSSSTVTTSSSSPSRSPSPNLKTSNVPKRKKLSPAVNEGASTSKQGLDHDYTPNSSLIDCVSTCGRYSNISWISDSSNGKNGSPSGSNQSPSNAIGLQKKTKILNQNFKPVLNHPSVSYAGHIPEVNLISTCSKAAASLFNLFEDQMFGLISVDQKGAHPVNFGSTHRGAINIKEIGKLAWPSASLNLWFVKAKVLNFESTERNYIRFYSNISSSRPYCIFLLNQPFRYKSNVNYLVNLVPSDPKSGRGQALNALTDTDDLFYVSMIQHISPLKKPVKTAP